MRNRYWLVVLMLVLGTVGCLGGGGITQFTLTMEIEGQGAVDPPVGEHTYNQNMVVDLTATPDDGWKFVRWDGDVADPGAPVTEVAMDGNKTVKAVFEAADEPTTFTLTVEVQGQGTPEPPAGQHEYDRDAVVDLTATPDDGWEFVRWDGDVADPNAAATTVVMDENKTVTAVFDWIIETSSHAIDGLSFNMRLAPAVTFPTETDDSGSSTVDTPFWIAETHVTYELWYTVRQWATHADRGDNGYSFANAGREGSHGNDGEAPTARRNEPVTSVSWRDSIVWCNAFSEMLGYQPVYTYLGNVIRDSTNAEACDNAVQENTTGFRLPTSDEWELAARYKGSDSSHGAIAGGGLWWTPGNYASGATADYGNAEATQEVAWYEANSNADGSGRKTQDVGLKRANGLGVYDMSGNVWDWCFTPIDSSRVRRGGHWFSNAHFLQVGDARSSNPDVANSTLGLRLARTQF